jgi:hypothetical protein
LRLQLSNLPGNHFQHARKIRRQVGIPKSEYRHTSLPQPLIPLTVSIWRSCMLAAVQLHGELQCWTVKIQNVATYRMLSAKACAVDLGIPQPVP